jgi:dihydrofolate synthase/folylpolyglutamate synthase
MVDAIAHTAKRTGFSGRWQQISDSPVAVVDIGHNEHGLKYNFAQLQRMKDEGKCTHIIMVYGSVADKDVDSVIHLMPEDAVYIFTQAQGKRALPATVIYEKYSAFCASVSRSVSNVHVAPGVAEAIALARELAAGIVTSDPSARPLIYIGGSTYVVSEAVALDW